MTRRLVISSNDFNLFDGELNSYEYEYFCKHIGAFKRFMQEEPAEQRQQFLDAFCEYSYNHIEIRAAIASMSDPKKKFIESFKQYVQEAFVNAKFSAAKQFLNDSVTVARNRHMISYMDSHSYAKDPFFHKETRDVFRRLFGEPTEAGTCVKVVCVLPLYVRFAGSVCRYLKKWLDMEEMMYPMPVKSGGSKKSRDKRAMKDQAIASRNSKTVFSRPAVDNSKTLSTVQKSSSTVGNPKSIPTGQQSTALVSKTNGNSTEQVEDDLSSFYYDMHERKQRKREERKKGKKHEIACQHPCHGKGKGCCSQAGGHDHHHHHHHDAPQPSQEQLMACLCEKHRVLAEAKIAEKKAALEKHRASGMCGAKERADENSEDKSSGDKSSEVKSSEDKSSEDKSSEDKCCENKNSEHKSSEEKSSDDKISAEKCSEDKSSCDKSSEIKNLEAKYARDEHSENRTCEDKSSDDKSLESKLEKDSERQTIENKNSEALSTNKKDSESQTSQSKDSEGPNTEGKTGESKDSVGQNTENKDSERQTTLNKDFEGKTSENKDSEDQTTENKDVEERLEGNEKSEDREVKTSVVKSPTGKKSHSHKRIRENGVVSSDSDCDEAVERFVRTAFPELHLCEPHPNQQYENMLADERAKEKLKETKFRTCAFCRKQEMEIKTFKKCQKCKGKGTKFYCSRECQKLDWTKHRLEH